MTVAVTAASGRLGSKIVEALVALGDGTEVVALARTPKKAEHLGAETRPGDYNKRGVLEQSLDGLDTVLLVSGVDAPERRIDQHRNVIEAAKSAGVTKIVYTSVQGAEESTAFSPIIQSSRQTEQDVRESGLAFVIGRNGIYIESEVEYIDAHKEAGGITNCAGDGRCGYTTRDELAFAYARMLTDDAHNGHTYNLHGEAITQYELAAYLSRTFGTDLHYTPVTVEECRAGRVAELGEFMGSLKTGIYESIRIGEADHPSHFNQAAGRDHVSWGDYFARLES